MALDVDRARGVAETGPEIVSLRPEHVASLRLRGHRRSTVPAIRALVESYAERSVWVPATLEYALLAPWRHRDEIAVVQELSAVANAEALLAAAIERCRVAGTALLLVIEMEETRRPVFYQRAGLDPIEEVITYELDRPWATRYPQLDLTFHRVSAADEVAAAELLRIDHASFPWLWWNNAAEFAVYAATPGVQAFIGTYQSRPIGYVGTTSYPGWGHLDRIAVLPELQGRGFGRQALAFAIDALVRGGARRIGLSTQLENVRSQHLYEGFGFRRSPGFDYRLYGAALRPPAVGITRVEDARGHPGVEESRSS
jgi:ribosomal protein S18 acetylase RimI-like enzyme